MLPKCWPKSSKTAISGIFPDLLTGKISILRNGYHRSLNIVILHLWAKKGKNRMIKSWEKSKKPWFPVYFRHIFAPKILIGNIRLDDYLAITILHLCAKFQRKMLLLCRDMLEKTFFRRFRPVPVIFEQFRVRRRLLSLIWHRF